MNDTAGDNLNNIIDSQHEYDTILNDIMKSQLIALQTKS